ncbi:hypothetical protein DPMN_129608, partial [Dreissena polymorpha]
MWIVVDWIVESDTGIQGLDCSIQGLDCRLMQCGLDWIGLDCRGLMRCGLDWIGLMRWIGLLCQIQGLDCRVIYRDWIVLSDTGVDAMWIGLDCRVRYRDWIVLSDTGCHIQGLDCSGFDCRGLDCSVDMDWSVRYMDTGVDMDCNGISRDTEDDAIWIVVLDTGIQGLMRWVDMDYTEIHGLMRSVDAMDWIIQMLILIGVSDAGVDMDLRVRYRDTKDDMDCMVDMDLPDTGKQGGLIWIVVADTECQILGLIWLGLMRYTGVDVVWAVFPDTGIQGLIWIDEAIWFVESDTRDSAVGLFWLLQGMIWIDCMSETVWSIWITDGRTYRQTVERTDRQKDSRSDAFGDSIPARWHGMLRPQTISPLPVKP